MRGGTSCSKWLAASQGNMQDATTPTRCQAARLELMQGATASHTWMAACFGCMCGDTSCLVDPPRASTCQAACLTSMHGDTSTSVNTHMVRQFPPRSEPMQRATSSFSVRWPDFGPSG
ncbi:hypothetical protein F2Q70_00011309 [Brassica cretica]|uniref:Uncharacterized protein n=1 Tax=Brassica cretica TaxID=69181 RepID=A0A8S9M379_BRACR|nr:hypothetical protein F2Q68_00033597 [Brassica cretica]KAF2611816.1 hypothetical protein F2Q70_00011309 [Brassica cretica]